MPNYKVSFNVDGQRIDTVKKKIVTTFGEDAIESLEILNNDAPVSRADRLSDAQAIVEGLRDELQEWRDNLPDNMQDGQKAQDLDEAITNLDNVIEAVENVEFPSMM
jgi:hypothetical protein